MSKVRRPFERLILNVQNQSDRGGAKPRLIVLHDTESKDYPGTRDLAGIGSWFNNLKSQASSHVCVDGSGISAQFVPDDRKAWHCAVYNRVSLGIEQIGFSTFSLLIWSDRRKQLAKVAQYIAYWSKKYDIPIQKGRVNQGSVVRPGVVTHRSLGAFGGGHHDPGLGYPLRLVLALARHYAKHGW